MFFPRSVYVFKSALQTWYPQVKCLLSEDTLIGMNVCFASKSLLKRPHKHFCSAHTILVSGMQGATSVHYTFKVAALIRQSSASNAAFSQPPHCSVPHTGSLRQAKFEDQANTFRIMNYELWRCGANSDDRSTVRFLWSEYPHHSLTISFSPRPSLPELWAVQRVIIMERCSRSQQTLSLKDPVSKSYNRAQLPREGFSLNQLHWDGQM